MERAVRPCLPITFPTSAEATRRRSTVFSSLATACTSTACGSLPAVAYRRDSVLASSHRPQRPNHCRIVSAIYCRPDAFRNRPWLECLHDRALDRFPVVVSSVFLRILRGDCRGGISRQQLGHAFGELRSLAGPVLDPLPLQIDGGGIGAGIVRAYDFNRPAIAGPILFNNNHTIIRLLPCTEASQTNHQHRRKSFQIFFPDRGQIRVGFWGSRSAGKILIAHRSQRSSIAGSSVLRKSVTQGEGVRRPRPGSWGRVALSTPE